MLSTLPAERSKSKLYQRAFRTVGKIASSEAEKQRILQCFPSIIFPVKRLALLRQSLACGQVYPDGNEKVPMFESLALPMPNLSFGVWVIVIG